MRPVDLCCVYASADTGPARPGYVCDEFRVDPGADWREDCTACGHAETCHNDMDGGDG